jgi:hypothetical protein
MRSLPAFLGKLWRDEAIAERRRLVEGLASRVPGNHEGDATQLRRGPMLAPRFGNAL